MFGFFKKSWQKKPREIKYTKFFTCNCIFGSFKFSPTSKIDFLAIFEIAKNGIWWKNFFMKLIYLISRVFLAWTFLNFLAYCGLLNTKENISKNVHFSLNHATIRTNHYLLHDFCILAHYAWVCRRHQRIWQIISHLVRPNVVQIIFRNVDDYLQYIDEYPIKSLYILVFS